MDSRLLCCVMAALMLACGASHARAAELKIEFGELARILSSVLAEAKLRLHNAPGGILDFSSPSFVDIAGKEVPIPVPVRSFEAAGARYAYYLNDINSASVKVEAVSGALRLSLQFEQEGPELVGRCLSGFCPPNAALPSIEWAAPTVSIDLAPVKVDQTLSLEAKRVAVGGQISPVCRRSVDFVSVNLCRAILNKARAAVAKLRGDLDDGLKRQMNAPEVQEKIAAALRPRLVLGPAGPVNIRSVAVEAGSVTVSFCLTC